MKKVLSLIVSFSNKSQNSIYASSGQTVRVKIDRCARVQWSNRNTTTVPPSECGPFIYVKLYNPKTGSYTANKVVESDGYVTFTNMRDSTYYVYFSDSRSAYYYRGFSTASSYAPGGVGLTSR
jgi:hypothetical protein